MDDLYPDIQRRLTQAVERMPAFPKSVQRILEITRNINCLPKEVIAVIEKDPVMTIKVLRVINSAYYSLPNKINSVGQSVVYLGINTIKNLALSFAAVGILPRDNMVGFDARDYLIHSLVTAGISRQLCTLGATGGVDPTDCFVAGLLHDFGKAVFAQFMEDEFQEALDLSADEGIPLCDAEREIIGADHGVVGAMLAQKWQFAMPLVEAIRDHHDPVASPSGILDCVRVADQIARLRRLGDAGNPFWEGETVAAPGRFGSDFEEIIARVGDMDKIVADAMLFAEND